MIKYSNATDKKDIYVQVKTFYWTTLPMYVWFQDLETSYLIR